MPAALREWWRGILAAVRQAPWRSSGTDGAQGAGAASTDATTDTTADATADAADNPARGRAASADPSYNQLVREAMGDRVRAELMNMLDRNRTSDHVRMFTTKIRYCTGCILVLMLALAGLLALMGALHLTSFLMVGPVIGGFMAPVVGLSRQLVKLISQAGNAAPTLSDDRRAVVPAQRPDSKADDPA
ncbi:hypothetical protein ACGFSB_16145 [Streptomyces sp. NPDC048441]|uniref:hypothetical protein n=1 Tax=Streptomyces sp. NPDC048441 TaxID=3365552 RepID=UPI0037171B1B